MGCCLESRSIFVHKQLQSHQKRQEMTLSTMTHSPLLFTSQSSALCSFTVLTFSFSLSPSQLPFRSQPLNFCYLLILNFSPVPVTSKDGPEFFSDYKAVAKHDIRKDLIAIHSCLPLGEAHNDFWGLPSNPFSIYHTGPA